jgi:uncharacterized metal-binding protein YceD (DUF177 family)
VRKRSEKRQKIYRQKERSRKKEKLENVKIEIFIAFVLDFHEYIEEAILFSLLLVRVCDLEKKKKREKR